MLLDEDTHEHHYKEVAKSEQDAITPEEARDLQEKLGLMVEGLTANQRTFLSRILAAGAQSEEVQGYMLPGADGAVPDIWGRVLPSAASHQDVCC